MKQKETAIGSRVFNFRLFLEALKRLRVIGIAVAILALTAAILIPTVMWIDARSDPYRHGEWVYEETVDEFGNIKHVETFVPKEITPQPVEKYLLCIPLYVVPFLAPFFFLVLFSFLHKRKESDFYHAIPYTRTCVYISFVSAALAFVFLIQIASALISGMIYGLCPYTTFELSTLVCDTATSMLAAAFLASFMMLSLTVTGTGATTILMFLLFASIVRIVLAMFGYAVDDLTIVSATSYPYLSPYFFLPIRMFAPTNSYYSSSTVPSLSAVIPYTLIVTLLIYVAAGLLYKLRRSEMAERSAPSKLLQSIFRCLFTLPFALMLTLLVITDEIEFSSFMVLLTITLVVFFLYELITTKRPRNMLRATPWLSVVLGAAILFAGVYASFFYTVHREIPENRIEAVMVETDGASTFESINTASLLTEDDSVVSLVSDALSDTCRYILHDGSGLYEPSVKWKDVTIRLTSGRTVKRTLRFSEESMAELETHLIASEEYREHYLELPPLDSINWIEIGSEYSYHYYGTHFEKGDKLNAFYEIFRTEYEALSDAEKLAFKKRLLFVDDEKYPDKGSGDKVTVPPGAPISVDTNGAFALRISFEGYVGSDRYYTTYYLPLSMPRTIEAVMERASSKSSYQEFFLEPDGKEGGATDPILLSTDHDDTPHEIAKAAFDLLKTGTLAFSDGEMSIAAYGKHELQLHIVKQEPSYTEFFALLSEYVTKSATAREGTIPVYFYSQVEKYNGDEYVGRLNLATPLLITEDEYNELLFALGVTPFE